MNSSERSCSEHCLCFCVNIKMVATILNIELLHREGYSVLFDSTCYSQTVDSKPHLLTGRHLRSCAYLSVESNACHIDHRKYRIPAVCVYYMRMSAQAYSSKRDVRKAC